MAANTSNTAKTANTGTPNTGTPGGENEAPSPATTGAGADRSAGQEISFTVPQIPAMNELMEPKRLLWFGGLAAAGVVGVLEWPVVAAVGIGSYVAERFAESNRQRNGH